MADACPPGWLPQSRCPNPRGPEALWPSRAQAARHQSGRSPDGRVSTGAEKPSHLSCSETPAVTVSPGTGGQGRAGTGDGVSSRQGDEMVLKLGRPMNTALQTSVLCGAEPRLNKTAEGTT